MSPSESGLIHKPHHQEVEDKTFNVRTRDKKVHGEKTMPQMLEMLHDDVVNYR